MRKIHGHWSGFHDNYGSGFVIRPYPKTELDHDYELDTTKIPGTGSTTSEQSLNFPNVGQIRVSFRIWPIVLQLDGLNGKKRSNAMKQVFWYVLGIVYFDRIYLKFVSSDYYRSLANHLIKEARFEDSPPQFNWSNIRLTSAAVSANLRLIVHKYFSMVRGNQCTLIVVAL